LKRCACVCVCVCACLRVRVGVRVRVSLGRGVRRGMRVHTPRLPVRGCSPDQIVADVRTTPGGPAAVQARVSGAGDAGMLMRAWPPCEDFPWRCCGVARQPSTQRARRALSASRIASSVAGPGVLVRTLLLCAIVAASVCVRNVNEYRHAVLRAPPRDKSATCNVLYGFDSCRRKCT
jgi:hypothetical protein